MAKILIIEDDVFLSRVYEQKLKMSGFEVFCVSDGNEAKKTVDAFQPNLILLDVMLPGKNGFTILDEIKADQSTSQIPVLMISNAVDLDSRSKKSGAVSYFLKCDIGADEMVGEIKRVLTTKQA